MKPDVIDAILDKVRLLAHRHRPAGDLSHGQKQWLEIAMLLAQDPKLLLVDEPVAGMTDAETEATAELLKEINRDHSVIVVEHDMHFVRALECKVTCLHEGSVLSEGTIDAVASDKRVIEVYLGAEYADRRCNRSPLWRSTGAEARLDFRACRCCHLRSRPQRRGEDLADARDCWPPAREPRQRSRSTESR